MRSVLILIIVVATSFGLRVAPTLDTPIECPDWPLPVPLLKNNESVIAALADVATLLQQSIAKYGVPGLVVSIVYNGQVLMAEGFGEIDPLHPRGVPPTADSIVQIASVTKTFTAGALMVLRDAGTVASLDDTVSDYFPDFSIQDPYTDSHGGDLTLQQLGSHTSGLPRDPPCNLFGTCTQEDVFNISPNLTLVLPAATRGHYSNFGVAMLGHALAEASGTSYEDLVTETFLEPLGMRDTGFNYTQDVVANMTVGVQRLADGSFIRAPLPPVSWTAPAGQMYSTANDMARWMNFLLGTAGAEGEAIMATETRNEWIKPVIMFENGQSGFGMPWEFDLNGNFTVYSKVGDATGYHAQMSLIPALNLGIFLAGNVNLYSIRDTSYFAFPALNILVPPLLAAMQANQVPPLPIDFAQYVGNYSGDQEVINITVITYNGVETLYGSLYSTFAGVVLANLTFEPVEVNTPIETFRLHNIINEACRWLDDGYDMEFVQFVYDKRGQRVLIMHSNTATLVRQ